MLNSKMNKKNIDFDCIDRFQIENNVELKKKLCFAY